MFPPMALSIERKLTEYRLQKACHYQEVDFGLCNYDRGLVIAFS